MSGIKLERLGIALLILFVTRGAASGQDNGPPVPWELSPYRISVLIAVQPSPDWPATIDSDVALFIDSRTKAIVGGSWKLTAAPAADELRKAILADVCQVAADDLRGVSADADKVILLIAKRRAKEAGHRVEAREWDLTTNLWNAPVAVDVAQPELLPQAAFRAVLAAFAPLARIETAEGDSATLRFKAGAIGHRDHDLPRLPAGAVFRPVVGSDVIPWTYLVPQDTHSNPVRCKVETGLAGGAIPAYHPLRQRLAIGVSPSSRGTTLKLIGRGEKGGPLEGYEILADEASGTAKPIGRSDREGKLTVPPAPQALRWLTVRYGEQPLQRLPLVPGLTAELTLPLSDVRGAASIDAALAELEDALVDLAARREVIAARLKSADAAAQAKLNEQLAKLPKVDALAGQLGQHEQAVKSSEPLVQSRLQAKITALRKLIDQIEPKPPPQP